LYIEKLFIFEKQLILEAKNEIQNGQFCVISHETETFFFAKQIIFFNSNDTILLLYQFYCEFFLIL